MSLFASPTASVGVARILFNTLVQSDGVAERGELLTSVAPPERPDYASVAGNALVETLDFMVQLGVFEINDGMVSIASGNVTEPMAVPDFRRLLQTSLLAPAAGDDLLTSNDGGRDLLRAVAWALAQNPLDPFRSFARVEQLQDTQLGFDARPIPLVEQWRPFERWSTSLGYLAPWGRRGSGGKTMRTVGCDPTLAIRDVLVTTGSGNVTASAFLGTVASHLPVVDGGAVFEQMRSRYAEPPPGLAGGGVSLSVSLALLRLIEGGQLRASDPSDAAPEERIALMVGNTPRMVGELSWGESHE